MRVYYQSQVGQLSPADLIPAIVHISSARRGTTERLSGDVVRVDPSPDSGIVLVHPDVSTTTEHYATLHSAGQTYELAVAVGQTVWVNGKKLESKVLESGDHRFYVLK